MEVITINNRSVVQPSALTYTRVDYDSEDSFRSMSGDLVRDRIAIKVKLQCQWNALTSSEMSALLHAMADVFFPVTYFDPYENNYVTKTMYVGDRSAPMYNLVGDEIIYKTFSCNFIEK